MEIDVRIAKARTALIMTHAFLGVLAMRLIVRERRDIRTLATDGTYLFHNPAFLDTLSELEILFCVAHEVLHCVLLHMTRRNGRTWELWQAATDYVVNLMLEKAGFVVPKWVKYFDRKYDGLNVEQVYQILEQEQQKQQQQNQQPQPQSGANGQQGDDQCESSTGKDGDPSDSNSNDGTSSTSKDGNAPGEPGGSTPTSSAGNDSSDSSDGTGTPAGTEPLPPSFGDPGGCGEVLDAAPPQDKAAQDAVADEWQVYTRQAANIARRQGEGRTPGYIEEVINVLNESQTNWREALRRFVDPSSTKDFSWANPNRRMMGLGYYTPGQISDGVSHVAMLIDSSSSVDTEWLRKFGGEVQSAMDEGVIDKLTLIFIDEVVQHVAEYTKSDIVDFTVKGRGGTRFAPGFRWLEDNAPDVTAAIYFTDLDSTDFGPEPSYPVLWAAYDSDPRALKRRIERVPFGEVIELRN